MSISEKAAPVAAKSSFWSQPVANAVIRHGVTIAGTLIVAVGAIGIISPADAAKVAADVNQLGAEIGAVFATVGSICLVVSPYIAAWTAKQSNQIAAVNAIDGVKVVPQSSRIQAVDAVPVAAK